MSLMGGGRRLVVTAAAVLSMGCHHTAPITAVPAVGARVTVTLTPDGSGALARELGPNVSVAEGRVQATRGDTIVLTLIRTEQSNGIDNLWQGQPVAVPRSAVAAMTERRLDRKRSWLAAGAIVGLAVLAAVRLSGGGQVGEIGPIVTPPN